MVSYYFKSSSVEKLIVSPYRVRFNHLDFALNSFELGGEDDIRNLNSPHEFFAEDVGVEPTLDLRPASLANLSRDRLSHPPLFTCSLVLLVPTRFNYTAT